MRPRDLLELTILAALWGGSFLFVRIAVPQFGALPLIALRTGLAALLLAPLLAIRVGPAGLAELRRSWRELFVVGLVNSAVPFVLFAYALLSLGAGVASVLNATAPMFGALIARLWLGERLTAVRWAGLALGATGVTLLLQARVAPGEVAVIASGEASMAVLACLAASLCYGFAANYAKRRLERVDPLAVAAGSQVFATMALAPLAALAWPQRGATPAAWGAVAALGVFSTGLAYLLYFRLIRNVGPSRAISVTFLIPLFGVALGVAFLAEPLTVGMVTGGVVVVLGTAMATGALGPREPADPARPLASRFLRRPRQE